VPFWPWFALVAVAAWRTARWPVRAAIVTFGLLGVVIAIPSALRCSQVKGQSIGAVFSR
jgi:hypothetical protein